METAAGVTVTISDLMERTGVKFGTSGARGLVSAMTDQVCYAYTAAFLRHLHGGRRAPGGTTVAIAGDLRQSTGRMLAAVAAAVRDAGCEVQYAGRIPSPAIALWGLERGIATVMVTGSHIADDRNGIKFNTPKGEILKEDEAGIRQQVVELPPSFTAQGMLRPELQPVLVEHPGARDTYVRRYLSAFRPDALAGRRLGLYEHSAVGSPLFAQILAALGADVVRFGRSETFIPVDTEAIRPEDVALAAAAVREHGLDAVVSSDGDSDRPLISDEHGKWLRGDIAGILCARYLGADVVVTPVSSNSALEACRAFPKTVRTRIGSPYVIAAMNEAASAGTVRVVGYEANGGFLTASPLPCPQGVLPPLPTRDATIVHLAILAMAVEKRCPISALLAELPRRFTSSGLLRGSLPSGLLAELRSLAAGGPEHPCHDFRQRFGAVHAIDDTDGVRLTFAGGGVVHVRASGNAPEVRCYVEAAEEAAALDMRDAAVALLAKRM